MSTSDFIAATGADDVIAEFYLHEAKGNLQEAVLAYYETAQKEIDNGKGGRVIGGDLASEKKAKNSIALLERYRAAMILSAAGDGTIVLLG